MNYGYDWGPYVSVGEKKVHARKFAAKLAKKQKRKCQPIQIEGRKIAKSFWGKAWCDHLESLSDYANRLPRGRTYVRNGSVVDLVIKPGEIEAIVAGSDPYQTSISIQKLGKKTWGDIKKDCSSSIDSLLDLLGGRLSDGVMRRLTDKKSGCFPSARQIEMDCDCPDWSICCKHIAAVMYAIGSRLDSEPELLFLLRGVDQEELIGQAVSKENLANELGAGSGDLAGEDLGAIFGIELESTSDVKVTAKPKTPKPASRAKRPRVKKATTKTTVAKKAATKAIGTKKKPVRATTKKKAKRKPTIKTASTRKKTGVKKTGVKKTGVKKTGVKKKATATQKATRKKKASQKRVTSKKKTVKVAETVKRPKKKKAPSKRKSKRKTA